MTLEKFARAAKAWFAALVAAVAVLELAVTVESDAGSGVSLAEWVRVAGAFVGALAITYNVTNRPDAVTLTAFVDDDDREVERLRRTVGRLTTELNEARQAS